MEERYRSWDGAADRAVVDPEFVTARAFWMPDNSQRAKYHLSLRGSTIRSRNFSWRPVHRLGQKSGHVTHVA